MDNTHQVKNMEYSHTDEVYDFIIAKSQKEGKSRVSVLREVIGNKLAAGSENELLLGKILKTANIKTRSTE